MICWRAGKTLILHFLPNKLDFSRVSDPNQIQAFWLDPGFRRAGSGFRLDINMDCRIHVAIDLFFIKF